MFIDVILSDHSITKFYYPVCHIFDGIVMGDHHYGISVFPVNGLNELQDLFGSIVIQGTGRFITEKDVRIFYNGTSYSCTLLLTTGKLVRKFPLRCS